MNKLLLTGVALAGAAALAGCGQVQPGQVGIKVNQYGSGAGVQPETLGVGTYFTPFGTTIYEYPVYTRTYTYSASANEGAQVDESFSFQDKSGLALSANIGVSYSVNPDKAAILFQKYRISDDQIVAGPLRNAIRDSLITRASQLDVDQIYGPQKAQLMALVASDVRAYFAPYGLNVERLFWAGNIVVPDAVLQQINQRIANEQAALAAQAKVATVQAEAQQAIAEAQGKAQALNIEGAAIRSNPEVVHLRAIEKWDGKLPQVTGGATPFVSLETK